MTRRNLISLGIVPVALFVVSVALVWLSVQLQHGSERRQADYAVLQRVTMLSQSSNTVQAGARSAQTLSSLALAETESAVLTVGLARALASLLCMVALFQILSLAQFARRGQPRAGTAVVHAWPNSPQEGRLTAHPVPHQAERSVGS